MNSMHLLKNILLLLVPTLTTSCGYFGYVKESTVKSLNESLYNPPWIRLKKGELYEFENGTLTGDGQTFFSGYEYRKHLILKAK